VVARSLLDHEHGGFIQPWCRIGLRISGETELPAKASTCATG
jgi:hypothetical protein